MSSPTVGASFQTRSQTELFKHKAQNQAEKDIQKNGIWRVLDGLHEQLKQLQSVTAGVLPGLLSDQADWNKRTKRISDDLVACQKILPKKAKEKLPTAALNDLKGICVTYIEKLRAVEKLFAENRPKNEVSKALKAIGLTDLLPTLEETKTKLMTATKAESDRLKAKIDLCEQNQLPDVDVLDAVIFRISSLIPDYMVREKLDKVATKDASRIERYEALKPAWQEASLRYDEMRSLDIRLKIGVLTISPLTENLPKAESYQASAEALVKTLEDLSIHTFAKTFVEKNKSRRDLSAWQNSVSQYEKVTEEQTQLKDLLKEFVGNNLKYAFVEKMLGRLSEEINALDKPSDTGINLEDEAFKLKLKAQQDATRRTLVEYRDLVEQKWNQIVTNLNEINQNLAYLEKTQAFAVEASTYYLGAEDIREKVRFTRKEKTLRKEHQAMYDSQVEKFDNLAASVLAEDFENAPSLKTNYAKSLFSQEEIEKAKQPATLEEATEAGYVWTNDDKAKEILTQLNTQKARFVAHMEKHNAETKTDFETTLPAMFTLAVGELNRMGKYLQVETTEYDQCFNGIYERENLIGRFIGNTASAFASSTTSAAKNALALVWSTSSTEKPLPAAISDSPEVPAESVNVAPKIAKNAYVEKVSPFDTVK